MSKRYSCIAEADAEFRQTAKDGKIITAEMARDDETAR